MNQGQTLFAQVMTHTPHREFHRCVQRYGGDARVRRFTCWDHFLTLAFAQLTYRESLRDIEACLRARPGKLYHMLDRGNRSRKRPPMLTSSPADREDETLSLAEQGVPPSTHGIARQAVGGLMWISSGMGARVIFKMIVLAVLARILTPQDFGVIAAAMVVVRFSEIFSQLGVGQALVQRKELEPRHLSTALTTSVALGLLLAAVIWGVAPLLANFFNIIALANVVRGLSLLFPITAISVVAQCLLQRQMRFRSIAQIDIVSYLVGYSVVGIALALLGLGVWALVGALIGQSLVKSALLLAAKSHSFRFEFERQAWNELMYYGGGHTAARVSNYFALQGDYLVVGRLLGAAALGLYGRAYDLMQMPATVLGNVLDTVLFPTMAKVQDDPQRLGSAYRRGVALAAVAVLPLSGIIIVLAPELIYVFLGPQWQGAVLPFQILTVGMYFRTAYKVGISLARATGAVYRIAWRQAVYAGLVLAGALIGQMWGLPGVSMGVLFSLVGIFGMNAQLSKSLTSLSWSGFAAVHVPAALLTAVLALETWLTAAALRDLNVPALVVLAVCSALVAATVLLLLRLWPERVLGRDGVWMVRTLLDYLPWKIDLLGRRGMSPSRAAP